MRRLKELPAALLLCVLALIAIATYPGANASAATSHREKACRPRTAVFTTAGLSASATQVARVAAPSHRPARTPHFRPALRTLRLSDWTDCLMSTGDVDTDSDDGVFTAVSWRYHLASDVRAADLPLGVDSHPQAPVARTGSPRAPPVA